MEIEKSILEKFDAEVKSRSTRCSVCLHDDIDAINHDIMGGLMKLSDIAAKYGFNNISTLSRHKTLHVTSNVKESLKEIVYQQILKGRIKDGSVGEIIAALKYVEPEACDKCPLKLELDKPKKSIAEVMKEFLGDDEEEKNIYITIPEYEEFQKWRIATGQNLKGDKWH